MHMAVEQIGGVVLVQQFPQGGEAPVGIVLSILAGIVMMAASEDLILIGLLVAVVGSLGSWIGSWFVYGFGELIETTKRIEKNTRKD